MSVQTKPARTGAKRKLPKLKPKPKLKKLARPWEQPTAPTSANSLPEGHIFLSDFHREQSQRCAEALSKQSRMSPSEVTEQYRRIKAGSSRTNSSR